MEARFASKDTKISLVMNVLEEVLRNELRSNVSHKCVCGSYYTAVECHYHP